MIDRTAKNRFVYIIGVIPVVWFSLLVAPYIDGGLIEVVKEFPKAMENPLRLTICVNSIKVSLIFMFIYIIGIAIYESTKKNYRRKEEHGSARWGEANTLNKKYKQIPANMNKTLTKNVEIGLNGRVHKRNVNVLVVGRKSEQVRLFHIVSQM